MKYLNGFLIGLLLASPSAMSDDRIKKMDWDGIDVIWIEDNRYPTFDVNVYFADGGLSDGRSFKGMTDMAFSLLTSGTRRYSQKDLSDNLEYYGASYGGNVTHETVNYKVSGLLKDMVPTMKKVCHIFKDASYPKKEIKKAKRMIRSNAKTLVNNHSALASRAFRELSLGGTPYSYPVSGKLKDLKNFTQKRLKNKLAYFNKSVKKRIYIAGPKGVLKLKSIFTKDCGWSGEKATFERKITYKPVAPISKPKIYLVTVPKANQAQIRFGRFLNDGEFSNEALVSLSSEYLGGGFTSKLMREIRVKRGLSYTASAYAGGQRQYGRSVISTFTKESTVGELISVVKDVLINASEGKVEDKDFKRAQMGLAGSTPFRFERTSSYMNQLMRIDDRKKSYSSLYEFSDEVRKLKKEDIVKGISLFFNWNNQTIVVLGPKRLKKQLKKFGKVNVISYKKFL